MKVQSAILSRLCITLDLEAEVLWVVEGVDSPSKELLLAPSTKQLLFPFCSSKINDYVAIFNLFYFR